MLPFCKHSDITRNHRWLICSQFQGARMGAIHWKWLHIYTRRMFAPSGQVGKRHPERSSVATTNGKSCCSQRIYQLQQRILANHSHLCHVSIMVDQPWWMVFGYLAGVANLLLGFIWSHFQWFAPLVWPQISHLWSNTVSCKNCTWILMSPPVIKYRPRIRQFINNTFGSNPDMVLLYIYMFYIW